MSALLRRSLIGVGLGVIVYALAIIWFDAERVSAALEQFQWWVFPMAIGASCLNYLLRFAKWELCLGWLEIRGDKEGDAPTLTRRRSLLIYLAGLSMSVSPGKVGEVLRSVLLRASDGVAFARTAPLPIQAQPQPVPGDAQCPRDQLGEVPTGHPHRILDPHP